MHVSPVIFKIEAFLRHLNYVSSILDRFGMGCEYFVPEAEATVTGNACRAEKQGGAVMTAAEHPGSWMSDANIVQVRR